MWYNALMSLPQDNFILLSYVNTKLRDEYNTLAEFCSAEGAEEKEVTARLSAVGYAYDSALNAFTQK